MNKYVISILSSIVFSVLSLDGNATQYLMRIGSDSCYTNQANWLNNSQYAGYPGTTIATEDTVYIELYTEIKAGEFIFVQGHLEVGLGVINYGTLRLVGGKIHKGGSSPALTNFGTVSLLSGKVDCFVNNYGDMYIQSTVEIVTGKKISNYSELNIQPNMTSQWDLENRSGGILRGSADVRFFIQDIQSTYQPLITGIDQYEQIQMFDGSVSGFIEPILGNGYKPQDIISFPILSSIRSMVFECPQPKTSQSFLRWSLDEKITQVDVTAIPEGHIEFDGALDFGRVDDGINTYAYFKNTQMGQIKTIEFRIFPEVIDVEENGGAVLHFGDTGFSMIYQGQGYSALTGETLNIINSGHLYIKEVFQHRWHHISIVDENDDGRYELVYVDGVTVPVFTNPNVLGGVLPELYDINDFEIGGRIGTPYSTVNFKGRLDEIRFWRIRRTPADISFNKFKTLEPWDTVGLSAYYPMQQGRGGLESVADCQILKDCSNNGRDGLFQRFIFDGEERNWVAAASCPGFVAKTTNTFTFTSGASFWHVPSAWSLQYIPSSCNDVTVPANRSVVINQDAYANTLEINGILETRIGAQLHVVAPDN